ncbi:MULTISPECIES: DUF3159 domain-containing protein [Pseudonocardia]|uniref:Membrane protein n=1 Tax=Pseudonocardia saturnea TaxID=33909 RepID=A0ABQ0RXL1_9PSEU|nr:MULTISPECIES: DUF3159 domain-containing protein [Pseudonocardia]BBG01661.1 membrane protein [Pseudonocardia autotrophica]GEC25406.1 membrane protein [Pseudonocardia saturnea]
MSDHHEAPTTRIPRVDPPPAADEQTGPVGAPVPGGGREPQSGPTLMEQMGGISGIVASSIPVAVFVLVNLIGGLQAALYSALAVGVGVMVWRLVRRDPIQPAVSGLLGVGICALVARQTGEARGFYLPGLLISSFFALTAIVSMIVRWPIAGVIWNGINSRGMEWRENPALLRAYTIATGLLAIVFVSRVVVQGLLYDANAETWLGIARLAMGYPLLALALLATVLIVRRAESATPA